MNSIDCVLMHVPKQAHLCMPFGECMSIMLMPMGLLSLADKLHRDGIVTQVLHLGIELTDIEKEFSLDDYLRQHHIKVVGLSLYWHHQSFDTIDLAQKIKRSNPDIKIFIGGITASIFAHEILTEFAEIDAVVKGDAYKIVSDFTRSLLAEDQILLSKVPNILYRDRSGQVINTNFSYKISSEQFDTMRFSNLELMKNWKRYIKSPWVWICNNTNEENEKEYMRFPLPIGLGCNHACAYCGGSIETQQTIFNRNNCLYRSPQSVLNSILDAVAYGVYRFHICYNPRGKQDDAYYIKLFSLIRKHNLDLDVSFECWGLPSERFVDSFNQTFLNSSVITISPETAVEIIRSNCKGIFFTNRAFLESLEYLQKKKINTTLFFTAGLPYETLEDIKTTSELQHHLLHKFSNITIVTMPIELEPGSPIFIYPKKYSITKRRKVFRDFYQAHKNRHVSLGYDTSCLKENEILSFSGRLLVNFAFA